MRCDDGKTLEIRYSADGSFEQLTCGGKVWCRMAGDAKDDRIRRVAFANGDQMEILLGTVRVAASGPGGRIRFAERRSMIQMKIGGRTHRFVHGLTKDGRATFSDGDRNYSYDPKSRQILTLNDWTYAITEIDTKRRNAHFLRKRPDGETEEDYANEETGMRIRERKGCRHVWRVFTSGKNLRGRRRWAEEFYPQGYGSRTEYTYDESGALVMTRRTDRKSGEITEVRFAKIGRANYSKIIRKDGGFIEYWLDVKDGKLLRTMENGNRQSVCDYLYAPSGERVASAQNGKIANRFVPNADEFVKWHEDAEKGVKKPAPRIKTREEVEKENARNTNFIVFWTHPEDTAFDLTGLKAADTPQKMSLALERFHKGLYLRPETLHRLDIAGSDGRTHHLEIDAIKERGVDLEPGIWRVVQPNVQLMELSEDLRYRILSDGCFKKGTNDLHFAAVIFPKSAMVTVAGRVVDGRGKPLRGALVKGRYLPLLDYVTYPEIRAMTDDAGR